MNDLEKALEKLEPLAEKLAQATSPQDKRDHLHSFIIENSLLPREGLEHALNPIDEVALLALIAIGQEHACCHLPQLVEVEKFYEDLGGIVGYHVEALKRLVARDKIDSLDAMPPPGVDLTSKKNFHFALEGLRSLPKIGEIYPIGGLGDRLNLKSNQGEPLPAATLAFCGRTLLEGLIRDVWGREYLYYKTFGTQILTPIALMTSHEKQNEQHIKALLASSAWFSRPKESFFLFSQISVPVVTKEGKWAMKSPSEFYLQPGGHGALWRMAEEKGVYTWFKGQNREAVIIRQINNPIGGIDHGVLSLMGIGQAENKAFGFASCKRVVHAKEGVLVLSGSEKIVNIEYTDFTQFGIEDKSDSEGFSLFPANTNILYADLNKILPVIEENPSCGLILNMKSKVLCHTAGEVYGGRLESMMQSLSEKFLANTVFVTYNKRSKTIATTKRAFEESGPLLETPVGAFFELMKTNHELLKECGVQLPSFSSELEYLKNGPNLIFLYHPALGPLFEVIRQKIVGGKIAAGSQLQLEIAEIYIENLDLDGSLLIEASCIMGDNRNSALRFSDNVGRTILKNVEVKNRGVKKGPCNDLWKGSIPGHEALRIVIQGSGEFHAENVTFNGNETIFVGDKEKVTAFIQENGKVGYRREKQEEPSWEWEYKLTQETLCLEMNVCMPHKH